MNSKTRTTVWHKTLKPFLCESRFLGLLKMNKTTPGERTTSRPPFRQSRCLQPTFEQQAAPSIQRASFLNSTPPQHNQSSRPRLWKKCSPAAALQPHGCLSFSARPVSHAWIRREARRVRLWTSVASGKPHRRKRPGQKVNKKGGVESQHAI